MSSVKTYWQSLDQWSLREGSDPYHDPDGRASVDALSAVGRRRFLALMAASVAAAGVSCKKAEDRGEIVPYLKQPEGSPPGTPLYYASCLLQRPLAPAVLVTTREGRPVKLEGNPDHPVSRGALGASGQAATLELYDPDRLKAPTHQGKALAWEAADTEIARALNQAVGAGKRILLFTPSLASPTARALVNEFKTCYPTTTHLPIEMFHPGEVVEGRKRAFGLGGVPHVDWERASVILSLDSDFLGESGRIEDQRGFVSGRRPDRVPGAMNRLWAVEGAMSMTGCNADHRLRLRPGLQGKFVIWLLNEIIAERKIGPLADHREILRALASASGSRRVSDLGIDEQAARSLLRDLVAHQGRSVILAGPHMPASLHVLVSALNASLGNEKTVLQVPAGEAEARELASARELARAAEEIEAGAVAILINLRANPAFVLPPDLRLGVNLSKIPLVISSSLLPDETGEKAHYLLPCTHDLESWGDNDAHAGLLALQQPVIAPLFDARQCEHSLLRWLPPSPGRPASYHEYLRSRWRNEVYTKRALGVDFESFWNISLHDGFITAATEFLPPQDLRPEAVLEAIGEYARPSPSGIDLVLMPSPRVFDGRFALRAAHRGGKAPRKSRRTKDTRWRASNGLPASLPNRSHRVWRYQ